MEEKTLSMKQAVTNITECGCAESPAPSISCRTLQHKCFVHVEKNDQSFPCISMINKFKEYFSSLYLAPSVCVCVCVCACMCVRENRQPEPEAETKTKRGREEQGGGGGGGGGVGGGGQEG